MPDNQQFHSAHASKAKQVNFSYLHPDVLLRRSKAILAKLNSSKARAPMNFSNIVKTASLDDEKTCSQRERVVKRFIDMLFLNGSGDVQMAQQ